MATIRQSASAGASASAASASHSAPAPPTVPRTEFWATSPSVRQLAAYAPAGDAAAMHSTANPSAPAPAGDGATLSAHAPSPRYVEVDGPILPEDSLIRYDVPFAPKDPRRSLQLRRSLQRAADASKGAACGADAPAVSAADVDPNVLAVLDSFILPRRWVDEQTGVEWEQHASPLPGSRTAARETRQRLHEKLQSLGAKRTGTCPVRAVLVAECFLEVIRQVVAECWERGLLLLEVHAERVATQAAHREVFESRVGHAMRLALKGEKDALGAEADIARLRAEVEALEQEEQQLRTQCAEFTKYAEEQVPMAEKQHADAVSALRKEGILKRNQLEQLLAVPQQP